MTTTHVASRFPEIDLARGVAVIMMVVFHTAFDLAYLGITPVRVGEGGLRLLALATAALFLFLVGISLSISSAHAREGVAEFVGQAYREAGAALLGQPVLPPQCGGRALNSGTRRELEALATALNNGALEGAGTAEVSEALKPLLAFRTEIRRQAAWQADAMLGEESFKRIKAAFLAQVEGWLS